MPLSETVLLLMALLGIGVMISGLFGNLPVPYTVLLVLVGMLLGNLSSGWQLLEPLHAFELSPELVFFIFLPVLLFESGLSLNARQLAKDVVPVLMLAVPALLVSTTIIGLGVWLLLRLPLAAALLFGALISATDPVAVVSLFKELGTPLRLLVLVEGESLFNDATAIVLFTILLALASSGNFSVSDVGSAVIQFLEVFCGGALVGFSFGLALTWLNSRLALSTSAILIASLILAYVSFIVAEHELHVSGVMAVVASAICFGILTFPRLSEDTAHALHRTWAFLAEAANTLLFLLIGMSVNLANLLHISGFVLLVYLLVVVARAISVYSIVPMTVNLFSLPAISSGERQIMWWGGLKGGLAIAIALSIPASFGGRGLIIDLTLGVVLLSLLINAPTIRPLIRRWGLDKLTDEEQTELVQTAAVMQKRTHSALQRLRDRHVLSKAGLYQAQRDIVSSLSWPGDEVSAASKVRKQVLDALSAEGRELDRLFATGLVAQYAYLELKSELQLRRDRLRESTALRESDLDQSGWFWHIEIALLKRLREINWAAGLLAAYQNSRIAQRIVMDLARILMTESVLEAFDHWQGSEEPVDASLQETYRKRLSDLHARIADYQSDFGELYLGFETRFAKRAALMSVLREVKGDLQKGAISTKVYVALERAINLALERIQPLSVPMPDLGAHELLRLVPLFANLPPEVLERIASKATEVNYLTGDVVIGQDERGDALYVVARGRLRATRVDGEGQRVLGDLNPGDCFGEMALLGDRIRRATVTAVQACKLLRLSAHDVKKLAEQYPNMARYLNEINASRESILSAPDSARPI